MSKVGGFTLIELLMVLVLITAVIAFATPTYKNLITSNRVTAQVNQLVTAINFARSEAVRRHLVVTLCPSTNGQNCDGAWRDGWLVFTDQKATGRIKSGDQILRVYGALPASDQLQWHGSRSSRYLQLSPSGSTYGQSGSFIYCAQTNAPQAVIISQTGRIRLSDGYDAYGRPLRCN